MLPEPQNVSHNEPHSIASDADVIDLGYASLYSRWGELYIYLFPTCLVLSALFGFLAFKAGASADTGVAVTFTTLVAGRYIRAAIAVGFLLHPLYQTWKFAGTVSSTKTTAHVFTADGIELESANGPTLLPWNSISSAVETKKGFLFYRGAELATFLPSRHLEGPVEAELIRQFIRKNVADATLLG
jgi:YcxB-like protein